MELNALAHLPDATKDKFTPIFLFAPWPNALSLEKGINKIEEVYQGRPYFLELDQGYSPSNPEQSAQSEFLGLKDPSDSFAAWRGFVLKYPRVIPAIQWNGTTLGSAIQQVVSFREADRPFLVRLNRHDNVMRFTELLKFLGESGEADFVVSADAGWTSDEAAAEAWLSSVLEGPCMQLEARTPVVVSYSASPKSYTHIDSTKPKKVTFSNRQVYERLVARHSNFLRLTYGDWATTRPREPGGGGQAPARIDLPIDGGWMVARSANDDWTYQKAAKAIVDQFPIEVGPGSLWGEKMIADAALGRPSGVTNAKRNIAARVNIHLHREAFYGVEPLTDLDDDLPENF